MNKSKSKDHKEGKLEKIDNKIDEWSMNIEPYIHVAIWISLLAVIIVPLLIYLYSKHKQLFENPYLVIGALLLLIPILLEIFLSIGIQKKLLKGILFFTIYVGLVFFFVYKNFIPGMLILFGYLISYLVISSLITVVNYFNRKFKEANTKFELAKETIISIIESIIPFLFILALKYILK